MSARRTGVGLSLVAACVAAFAPCAQAVTEAAAVADSPVVVVATAPSAEALDSLRASLATARRVRVTLASGQRAVSRAAADSAGLALEMGGGYGITEAGLGAPIAWRDVVAIDVVPHGGDESRAHRFASSVATGAVVGLGAGVALFGLDSRYWSHTEESWVWMPVGFVVGTAAGAVVGAGRAVLARPSAAGWTRVYEARR